MMCPLAGSGVEIQQQGRYAHLINVELLVRVTWHTSEIPCLNAFESCLFAWENRDSIASLGCDSDSLANHWFRTRAAGFRTAT